MRFGWGPFGPVEHEAQNPHAHLPHHGNQGQIADELRCGHYLRRSDHAQDAGDRHDD